MTMQFNAVAFAVILGYYLILNIIMYIAMTIDKSAAIKNKRRIPEKNFYIMAVLGGGAGGLFGMVLNHHKTRHMDFMLIFTVTAILHVLAAYLLIGKFAVIFA